MAIPSSTWMRISASAPTGFYLDYIDPAYRAPYQRLCEAVALQEKKGDRYALFGSRTAVVEQLETGRPLGVRDTFGLTGRSEMEHGRIAFPPGRRDPLPPIRHEVNWDVKARLEDMDRAMVDINVLFPTHVSSYCALRDVGFENALYRAYHRWVADYCAQAPTRLKWTVVANMRDIPSGVAEIKYWAERDPNLVGVYISPQAPGKKMLDNPDLYPLYEAAQSLDLPMLAHGGTARPPYGPGTFDLDGAWYLLHSFSNPWAGMAAMGALIGGGILELFPRLRVGDHRDRRRLGSGSARPARHALPDVTRPRAQSEAHAARGPGRGPLFPRHRQLGAFARILHRAARRGYVAIRVGLAAWRHRLARGGPADRRTAGPDRERATQAPRRERDAALPAN